jgi:hypothetical protein
MERKNIWELRVISADKKNIYPQLFTHRPTTRDVLNTSTVVTVRDMVNCFGIPRSDGPLMCRMAGTFIGEIQVFRLPLFENGEPNDDD